HTASLLRAARSLPMVLRLPGLVPGFFVAVISRRESLGDLLGELHIDHLTQQLHPFVVVPVNPAFDLAAAGLLVVAQPPAVGVEDGIAVLIERYPDLRVVLAAHQDAGIDL